MKKFTLNLLALLAALASTGALAQNTPSFQIPATNHIISTVISTSSPSSSLPAPVAPVLYVAVTSGAVTLANQGGATTFAPGQFGYTTTITQPPTLLLKDPVVLLAPPPTFLPSTGSSGASGVNKATAIDCVVR